MNPIFTYTDYRHFLKDYYDNQKKKYTFFSYQYLADHCGFKSKTYLYKVIKGEKALTVEGALKIGSFMKLKKKEMNYFQAIVLFTNSKGNKEKEFYFEKLQEFSKSSISSQLRQNQFEYFNNWYNSVIREIISLIDWDNDYSILANSVIPAISKKEAKKSVKLLLDLGLIKINKKGKYVRTSNSITTGPDITSLAVHNFQKDNLVLASEAIDRFKRPVRDISTITMSISDHGVNKISKEIANFRKKLINIAENEKHADRVYQINFQSFPLSLPPKDNR